MRVQLETHFELEDLLNNGIFHLRFCEHAYDFLDLRDFLEKKPFFFSSIPNNQGFIKHQVSPYSYIGNFISYVADSDHILDYLQNLSYHHYDSLERDIKLISPGYTLERLSGKTLADYLSYYKPVVENLDPDTFFEKCCPLKKKLTPEEFMNIFSCYDHESGHYLLPFHEIGKHEKLKNYLSTYCLDIENWQCLLDSSYGPYGPEYCYLKILDGNMHMIMFRENDFHYEIVDENNLDQIEKIILDFFSKSTIKATCKKLNQSLDFDIPTDAISLFSHLQFDASFDSVRNFANEKYNIKARGREEIISKVINKLVENPLELDHPIIFDMGESANPFRFQTVMSEHEKTDLFLRLAIYERLQTVVDIHSKKYLETLNYPDGVHRHSYYRIPNYFEIAKSAPDITL